MTIPVRELVEFTLRKGDIDFRYTGRQRGAQGTKAHQRIQKKYKEGDLSEVSISRTIEYEGMNITLQGRIDGIIFDEGQIIIDEIKSTRAPLDEIDEDFSQVHWAQGMVYAFLYSLENNLEEISVQLTYYQLESKEIKRIMRDFVHDELKEYVYENLIKNYIKWAIMIYQWRELRDESISTLSFPHDSYRVGQRKLIISIYKTIQEQKKIFVNGPTGIGKTVSTLFPSIMSMTEGNVEKIFYLTSKNTQREIVESTLYSLIEKQLKVKYTSLTAKEKICFKEQTKCNPEYCEYAKGHFDRLNGAIEDIFNNENTYTKELISQYAQKHTVCPFEFSLDLTLWSDFVLCDYNYIFDPRVSLKRFTEEKGKYVFLIDEAHNLVDRSRDMYSAELGKKQTLSLQKLIGKEHPLYNTLGKINKAFISIRKDEEFDKEKLPEDLMAGVNEFIYKGDKWLAQHNSEASFYDELLQYYFEVNNFIRIGEYYGENYKVIKVKNKDEIIVKLVCLDSSSYIKQSVENGVSSVFFSATLLPMSYFIELLGGHINEDYHMILESPFPEENGCMMICNQISTTYKNRQNSYEDICQYIYHTMKAKEGNYMIFFPSYEYMEKVYDIFVQNHPEVKTAKQSKSMTELERKEYIDQFDLGENIVAFAVLGGLFSESIDLRGDRLIGVVVVSVGLPKIGEERNLLKEYYDEINGKGFLYAYMYPGFNKVMQGVGRVIRSEKDRGVILLIDTRFAQYSYKNLFPKHWSKARLVKSVGELDENLSEFWKVSGKLNVERGKK